MKPYDESWKAVYTEKPFYEQIQELRATTKPRYRWSTYLKCWLLIGSRFEHRDPPRILS